MRNYIVLDTETAPITSLKLDNVEPSIMRVYDIGWCVVDGNTGAILEKRSYVVSEVFYNAALMKSAYYAEKLPIYHAGILAGEWQVASFLTIREQLIADCKEYSIKKVWAYNARFDMVALNETVKDLSNGFCKWFLPYGCKWRDIWDYAGSTICNTRKFAAWCLNNGYLSDKGNPQTGAEIVYRYISGNGEFIEQHTALSDAEIETAILQAAKRRKQKARHSMGQGWRDAKKQLESLN